VAPLAMGLVVGVAATAALSVGLAVAIAERDRRAERARRTRDRRLSLLPGEPPVQGFRRMVLGQLDLAIELLAAENSSMPTADAVHETRKALKRLRTLVKLLEDELGAQATAREQAILRDAGRRLAGARDAEVMVSTLEALLKRHPRKLARRAGVSRLRGRLPPATGSGRSSRPSNASTAGVAAGICARRRGVATAWRRCIAGANR
jgi:hypothetical protein